MGAPEADMLTVVDVSEAETPTLVASVVLQDPMGVATSRDSEHVFVVGRASRSLSVVDVEDPSSPAVVGVLVDDEHLNFAWGVALSLDGQYAYVTGSRSNSLVAVDVGTDAANPKKIGSVTDSTNGSRWFTVHQNDPEFHCAHCAVTQRRRRDLRYRR